MAYGTALAALADPTRRRVFERLKSGPKAVGAIARGLPVSRPAVSQHLKVLKEAGLVADQPEGTRRVYYIDPDGLGSLRAWLDQFWDQALVASRSWDRQDADESSRHGNASRRLLVRTRRRWLAGECRQDHRLGAAPP